MADENSAARNPLPPRIASLIRESSWIAMLGVVLFLLTLFSSFTGYLLPWDQLAFWAITVGTSIAGYAPVIGEQLRFLLLGDLNVGQEALLRFYVSSL